MKLHRYYMFEGSAN